MSKNDTHRKSMNFWRITLGWSCTIIWVVVFVLWSWNGVVPSMEPNEWGDWAAGLAAPIAFLWLVLGYFQQGEELRANVDALRLQEKALQLQVKELSESVKQQAAVAKATDKQALVAEKSQIIALRTQIATHQPTFVGFVPRNVRDDEITVEIQNIGAKCFNARILLGNEMYGVGNVESPSGFQVWSERSMIPFTFHLGIQPSPTIIDFKIEYQDELTAKQEQCFRFEIPQWPPSDGRHLHTTRQSMTFNHPDLD